MKRLTLLLATFALALTPLLMSPSSVQAQASNSNAADGLQISPAIIELNAQPGQTYTLPLEVMNVTSNDLVFNMVVNDFTAKDETGTPSVDLTNSLPESASIETWVSKIPNFRLNARQMRDLSPSITIPANAEPGGHYGVIRFSGRAPDVEGTGVGLSASAGTLVLVRVAGDIQEKLELATFETTLNNKQTGLFEQGPVTFLTRFKNVGSVHVKPVGQIEIRDGFGNKVETLAINDSKGNVLPDSVRRFETVLNKDWLFGRYTADVSVAYGTTGQAIVQTISFWVIPYKIILVGLLILVTLVFVFRTLLSRYNNYIINRAGTKNAKTNKKKK